jgi:hypothetical protein
MRSATIVVSRLVVLALVTVWGPVAAVSLKLIANESTALERITHDVRYLASDELEGRGPGTQGLQKAAEYIREEFQRVGLKSGTPDGSYFQPFEVSLGESPVPDQTHLVFHGPEGQTLALELGSQFQPFFTGGNAEVTAPVVFAGYGISAPDLQYDDYRDVNVEGKIVVLIRREPQQDNAESRFDGRNVTSHSYVVTKLKQALDRRAAAVLLVNDPYTVRKENSDAFFPNNPGVQRANIPFAQVKIASVDSILAASPLVAGEQKMTSVEQVEKYIDEKMVPVTQELTGWTASVKFTFQRTTVPVVNVVGVLEGEGPLAQETIVIGAHYDHLGYGGFGSRRPNSREIHNGADDNASGTAALLELARRFAGRQQPPARRLVFIAFSAEERGLIGSNYYVNNPLYPLENTIAMVNFDMIGTLRDSGLGVHGIGSGKEFEEIVDEVAKDSTLEIQKQRGVMAASDHFAFYQKKIPVVFFFTGLTDTYHTPDDDVERLNLEGMVGIIDFAENFLTRLQAHPKRIEYVQAPAGQRGMRGRGAMAYLGVIPDYAAKQEGVRVSGVREGSPASKAGLTEGDVIIRLGEKPITDVEALSEALREFRPGQVVSVIVRRGDQEVVLMVELASLARQTP